MIRFLHTADWQLGMRAAQVAPVAARVRKERLETARRLMRLARERGVDFILLAGDVFVDNQVENQLAHQVVQILSQASPIPVFILPGNHDPLTPDSIYNRRVFSEGLPPNIHVMRTREAVTVLPGVELLPAPCLSKYAEEDPTAGMVGVVEGKIRIGLAHGSLRIEGKYQPNDFPIDLDAAERLGLDYLALGHWHSFYQHGDRTVYPGTPEPTGFEERESGTAALVTLAGRGQLPQVEMVRVNGLTWETWRRELQDNPRETIQWVRSRVEELADPRRTILKLILTGRDTAEEQDWLEELKEWLRARLLHVAVDAGSLARNPLTPGLINLARSRPFLAATVADLAVLAGILGQPLPGLPPDLSGGDGPDEDLVHQWLREGLQTGDVEEALRVLGNLAGEV